ncbi:hypothetical protein D3C84_957310 [compost metagenome]
MAPTVALVCRASSAWALRLSVLSAAVIAMLKLSPALGLPLTVMPTLKVLAAPLASVYGTEMLRSLFWPGTMLPVPILTPLASNTS